MYEVRFVSNKDPRPYLGSKISDFSFNDEYYIPSSNNKDWLKGKYSIRRRESSNGIKYLLAAYRYHKIFDFIAVENVMKEKCNLTFSDDESFSDFTHSLGLTKSIQINRKWGEVYLFDNIELTVEKIDDLYSSEIEFSSIDKIYENIDKINLLIEKGMRPLDTSFFAYVFNLVR